MKNNSEDFELSKNSFKFITKAQWNILQELNLCTHLQISEKCNLNDESLKILTKCSFPRIICLNFHTNYFSDKLS